MCCFHCYYHWTTSAFDSPFPFLPFFLFLFFLFGFLFSLSLYPASSSPVNFSSLHISVFHISSSLRGGVQDSTLFRLVVYSCHSGLVVDPDSRVRLCAFFRFPRLAIDLPTPLRKTKFAFQRGKIRKKKGDRKVSIFSNLDHPSDARVFSLGRHSCLQGLFSLFLFFFFSFSDFLFLPLLILGG